MIFISVISAIVAVFAAGISFKSFQHQKEVLRQQKAISMWSLNYSRLIETEKMLKDNPKLLSFHGITPDDLKKCDASSEEVLYLLSSFRAAQEWSHLEGKENYPITKYRETMFGNQKVKEIWKNLLKDRLIFYSPFAEAVDKFLRS